MNYKVDLVVPYVNCTDPTWLEQFNKYRSLSKDVQNGLIRYRDSGTLELVLMSVQKFVPWVENIYLVVSSESQIPKGLDSSVRVILHKDYIPEQYLPMFNALALEVFLPFLPNTSDRFLYLNDDMIFTSPAKFTDFFSLEGDPLSTIKVVGATQHENNNLLNAFNLITGQNQKLKELKTLHGPAAFRKDWLLECYEKFRTDLLCTISPTKRSSLDYGQYVYQCYQLVYKQSIYREFSWKSFPNNIKRYESFDWTTLSNYVGICMNDCNQDSIEKYVNIVKNYIESYG